MWYQFRILNARRSRACASMHFRSSSREGGHFFNVITKLENLSRMAMVTINLERQSDRELFDILLVRYDVWLYWEKVREWERERTMSMGEGNGRGTCGRRDKSIIEIRFLSAGRRRGLPANLKVKSWSPRDSSREISVRGLNATQCNVATWLRARKRRNRVQV